MVLISEYSCRHQNRDLHIDYFGQTSPGDSAVLFAPGIISLADRFENAITFTPDGKECCFEIVDAINWKWGTILYAKYENNSWSEFKAASFLDSTKYFDILPIFSPDGHILLFSSARPSQSYNLVDLWMCKRTGENWGSPAKLDTAINDPNADESYSSISSDENIYFNKDNTNAIWFSVNRNGVYSKAIKVQPPINSEFGAGAAFIAPDESYIIFSSSKPDGYGESDLYISYRNADSTWTNPKNLGSKINSQDRDAAARISPDGKYLFFSRCKVKQFSDIYWVNTSFIEKFKK
jgi:Tol biopolymer transport system component